MRHFAALVALVGSLYSASALAQLQTRCSLDDQLGTTNAIGRNAWSRKCGYISVSSENYLNSEGMYQVYSQACATYPSIPAGSDCVRYAPISESEACVSPTLVKLGTCYAGCYTPEQRLMFKGEFQPIEGAYQSNMSSVTALTTASSLGALSFGEQAIRTYVAGKTSEDIFVLQAADGRRVEVTGNHPMVRADGEMVTAKTLQMGDSLLGADGQQLSLSRIEVFPYAGYVWNVQPQSKERLENILNAEGFLTGSVRFQNEWAEEKFRLLTRDELDVGSL